MVWTFLDFKDWEDEHMKFWESYAVDNIIYFGNLEMGQFFFFPFFRFLWLWVLETIYGSKGEINYDFFFKENNWEKVFFNNLGKLSFKEKQISYVLKGLINVLFVLILKITKDKYVSESKTLDFTFSEDK